LPEPESTKVKEEKSNKNERLIRTHKSLPYLATKKSPKGFPVKDPESGREMKGTDSQQRRKSDVHSKSPAPETA